ncbi:MAG: NAD-dependent epimerase/dehydratase family protein [Gemmataceae bacterium]
MLIAVTGGTGFLGRYIVRHLVSQGHSLRCWHRPNSDLTGFEDIAEQIEWVRGELGDVVSTVELVSGTDAVVHAALEWDHFGGQRSPTDDNFLPFMLKNVMGSLRLMHTAHRSKVGRFILISTCAVHEIILDDRPLDETHPLWPTSHYGAHKAALEKFVHSYGLGKEAWPICALRPTGIYGLAHQLRDSKWYDLVGQVIRGERIESNKGGKEVHAADVAKAVALLLEVEAELIVGQAINCYDLYVAEQDVAQIAKEMSGSPSVVMDLNQGPKNQIETGFMESLGMQFGGEPLLEQTIEQLVQAQI